MQHSRRKGPGRKIDFPRSVSKAGTKIAEKCNAGICTMRGYSLYGQELMKRFYNKRYAKSKFQFKVM